jgi:Mrp family chromosome partitioning ATPase
MHGDWEDRADDASTTIWNPDDEEDGGGVPYEEPPTKPRRSPFVDHDAEPRSRSVDHPADEQAPRYEPVAAVAPVVIEAEPIEGTDPSRPAPKVVTPALAAVKDAVLVDDITADPLELSRKVAPAPKTEQRDVRVFSAHAGAPFDPRLTLLADPYSDRADAYRSLARKLAAQGTSRVVAVTSAEEGEGKSTCAANLALALREGARGRVLLVEANLRAPTLAKMFDFTPPECFDQQLRALKADRSHSWAVVEQHAPLHVLAVDIGRPHAPMLDAGAFSIGIESLKGAGYDHVVLDTPPVLGGAAVNVVADHVDGVVLAVTARKTTRRALKRAVDQLAPAPILGIVLIEGA